MVCNFLGTLERKGTVNYMNDYRKCTAKTCPRHSSCKRTERLKRGQNNIGIAKIDLSYVCNEESNYPLHIKK